MSVDPKLMQRMMAGGGGAQNGPRAMGAPPPAPGGQGVPEADPMAGAPAAAPMSKPGDKKGLKAAAHTNLHIAVNMLEEALPAFGSESPEGGKILAALKILSGLMGKKDTSDLVPAEILQMVKGMPQMGGGTESQKQILKMMQGGGAPGQPPAGAPKMPQAAA